MILVFEMTWTGGAHAPGNSATIQTIARGCPEQTVRVFADAGHLAELRRDPELTAHPRVEFVPIEIYPKLRGKTQIVSFGRFRWELAALRRGLASVPRGESCLMFLISATPTAIFAASLLARLWPMARRGRLGVQIGLHGNLNDVFGWRSRNPLARAFDLAGALRAHHPRDFRFLVLEPSIGEALATAIPEAARRTDVLPLPINLNEIPPDQAQAPGAPLRVGLVGLATREKGADVFLDLAHDLRARYGDAIAFYLVGRAPPGADLTAFAPLAHAVTGDLLSRADYLERLARLHYVILPLREEYYRFSASGALLDAVTWLKPVIASRMPIVTGLFERFGDIGHLCDGTEGFRAVLEGLLANPDPARYHRQVEAMRQVRESRLPARLAEEYRAILRREFAGLLTAGPSGTASPRQAFPADARAVE